MAATANQPEVQLRRLEPLAADDQVSRLALMLAQAYLAQGKPAQAAGVLKRDLTLASHDSHSQAVLSEVLESLDDVDGALALVEEAAAEVCQQAGVFERLARLYEARGDEAAAQWAGGTAALLREGPAGRGGDPLGSSATMAEIYESQGHADEAQAIRRRLAAREPAPPRREPAPAARPDAEAVAPPVASPVPPEPPAPEPAADLEWDEEPEPLDAAPQPMPEPEPEPPDQVAWALERLERFRMAARSRQGAH